MVCGICGKPGRPYCPSGREGIECNYRARLLLGVPEWQAKALRAQEWRTFIERRDGARAETRGAA